MASISSNGNNESGGVLLLGASGRLGGMLRRHWPDPGTLRVQWRPGRGDAPPDAHRFELPVPGHPPSADALTAARGARAILCLSGVTPARAAGTADALEANVDLGLGALALAQAAGVPRLLLASSAAVYGTGGNGLHEGAAVSPVSPYGNAKLAMEQAVLARARTEQKVTMLRIGNVAGADAILGGWRPGMALDRFPDGRTPRRSYIGPQTLARVLHRLCFDAALPEVLNIAAPRAVEMGALLDAAKLAWQPRPALPEAIPEVRLDTNALEARVAFAPENGTPAGLVGEWLKDRQQQ